MSVNYYPSGNTKYSDFYTTSSMRKEIDLRSELEILFSGDSETLEHEQLYLFRKLGTTRCTCWDEYRHEGNAHCVYCYGEPYLWTEHAVRGYRMVASPTYGKPAIDHSHDIQRLSLHGYIFYFRYNFLGDNIRPNNGDSIISAKLDQEGKIIMPVERERKFKIVLPEDMRSDDGRIEYWRITTKFEHVGI